MADPIEPLIVDFIAWIAAGPKPYAEVMDAWRTSCPRLTVWEDAVDRGLVARRRDTRETFVDLTPLGRAFLEEAGRAGRPA
jgi:predicted transcriptional regulator